MTKFIIHGGNTREINSDNNSFFREMTSGFKGKVRILLCYFARKDKEINRCAEQDKKRILKNSRNKNLLFEIALPETLQNQLIKTDVFYMRGGETSRLLKKLLLTKNLNRLFKGRVIAGSSAGAYALSKFYWENDDKIFGQGLGVLNLKILCHYERKDKKLVIKLIKYKNNIPLLTLPNYKWVVIFK